MPDEKTTTETVKTASDGVVKISIEKYEELIAKAAEKAPVISRTIIKTPEMLAQEHKAWGWTFIGAGAALIGVGAVRVRLGRLES
jgi:hypothetical protein